MLTHIDDRPPQPARVRSVAVAWTALGRQYRTYSRPVGPESFRPALSPGPAPSPHRPIGNPQGVRDLLDPIAVGRTTRRSQAATAPVAGTQRLRTPLRIPHAPVTRPQPADVMTRALRGNLGWVIWGLAMTHHLCDVLVKSRNLLYR
jgi:hypothetical protein